MHKSMNDVEAACNRVEKDTLVCEENKRVIIDFSKSMLAKGSSRLRIVKCVYCLRFLSHWLQKPYSEATKSDLVALAGDLEGKDYADNTKYDFKIVLKMFYRWLKGNDEIYPPEISWLRFKLKNKSHKLPEELLTEEDVLRIARAATNLRDRALVLMLYESGCRIGELVTLRMKNVQFDQYGAVLRVTGKTGDRRVRIISSVPALKEWLESYDRADDPEAPL